MAINLHTAGGFRRWTVEIPVWSILAALMMLPPLALVVFMNSSAEAEESIPLSRNEVVVDAAGDRTWYGTMLNPSDSEYRELAVTIRFLDASNQPVGEARGQIEQLRPGDSLPLKAALPKTAVRMQMYSLQWRTGRRNFGYLLGPYRPWEFGYLQYDPAS